MVGGIGLAEKDPGEPVGGGLDCPRTTTRAANRVSSASRPPGCLLACPGADEEAIF